MTQLREIPANVARGAALLDERLPGWANEINPDKLDVSISCDCVLGQIFGSYSRGLDLLQVEPERYGFHLRARQTFDRLTGGWRAVIAGRRG